MDGFAHIPLLVRRWWVVALLGAGAMACATASDDPPGRVGRLADLQGSVYWFDQEQGQWAEAERNLPLTSGDRISTAAQGRAELRVGSSILRLAGNTEVELLQVDDQRMVFSLQTGSLAVRLRTREMAEETELLTAEARLLPTRAGSYRLDRLDDRTQAGSWRGTLRVDESPLLVETGQRLELWRTGRRGERGELRHEWGQLPDDPFAVWALNEDRRDERSAAARHVSPEMTGAEDLERHGRWEEHPEYGAFWVPFEVRVGWSPYRYGRWAWVRPWGWTWVDEAPWGFAPFHYGRWVHWRGRWGWLPGAYATRPVYAPALVAWVGGGTGPSVAWVALGPLDFFLPWYRSTPWQRDHINTRPHRPGQPAQPIRPPTGPILYGNQGTPGAVTVVPRDVLAHRRPVGRALIDEPSDRHGRGPGYPGWQPTEPPQRESRPPGNPAQPIMRTPPAPQPSTTPNELPHRDARTPDQRPPERHIRDRLPIHEGSRERAPSRPAVPERSHDRPAPAPVAPPPAPGTRIAPSPPAAAAPPWRQREPGHERGQTPEDGRKSHPEGRQSRERENLR